MDSNFHNHQQQQPQQIMQTGLTRYRSAPSSYFSNFVTSGMYEEETVDPFFNPQVSISIPEMDRIVSRFMSTGGRGENSNSHRHLGQIQGNEPQFMQQQHMIYQNHAQTLQPDHNISSVISGSNAALVDPSMAMDSPTNLLRQSSSPAGFLEHINIDNGYSMMRSMDKFRGANGSVPDSPLSSAKRSKSRMSFSSGPHSLSRLSSHIPAKKGKTMVHNNGGFSGGSWDEPTMLTDGFLKEVGESERINSFVIQNDEGRIHAPNSLTHHLSLPTSSAELSVMENLLQFQDIVPLRSRAKRGCATHPRSIAERVRRTRISERMRKLQELVPNMDKQTNTADMLDLAVDYIKQLQKQVETLSDHHSKCACPHKK